MARKPQRQSGRAELSPEEERVRKIVYGWYEESGMSQTQIGARLEWGQSWVSALLSGRSAITLTTLPPLAKVFGHKASDVYEKSPNKVADPETDMVMKKFKAIRLDHHKKLALEMMDSWRHR